MIQKLIVRHGVLHRVANMATRHTVLHRVPEVRIDPVDAIRKIFFGDVLGSLRPGSRFRISSAIKTCARHQSSELGIIQIKFVSVRFCTMTVITHHLCNRISHRDFFLALSAFVFILWHRLHKHCRSVLGQNILLIKPSSTSPQASM